MACAVQPMSPGTACSATAASWPRPRAFRLVLHARSIPFLAGAETYVRGGFIPGGTADNQLYFSPRVRFDHAIDDVCPQLLFDAQTSGGLLVSLPAVSQHAFLAAAAERTSGLGGRERRAGGAASRSG